MIAASTCGRACHYGQTPDSRMAELPDQSRRSRRSQRRAFLYDGNHVASARRKPFRLTFDHRKDNGMSTSKAALFASCLSVSVVCVAFTAGSQSSPTLTALDRQLAIALETRHYNENERTAISGAVAGLSATPRGAITETHVVSVTPVGSPSTVARVRQTVGGDSLPNRRALVTRYEYATGFTIRTWVDLDAERVLTVRNDVNYPTPLAADELKNAIAVMLGRDLASDTTPVDDDEAARYLHLVPLSGDMTAPRYGHRLVWLWENARGPSPRYLIDLTMNEIVEAP